MRAFEEGERVLVSMRGHTSFTNLPGIVLEVDDSAVDPYTVRLDDGRTYRCYSDELKAEPCDTPAPDAAPVETNDIDERRIAARDQEIVYQRRQIDALTAENAALKVQVQTMAFALEPFMEFYDHHSEVEWLDGLALQAMLEELDWSDFRAASEAFDKPKS